MKYDPLIYGRNDLERIVSIEPKDDLAEVFLEHKDGSIESILVPNEYWVLAHKKVNYRFSPLKGNLYYGWGTKFKSRKAFAMFRNIHKYDDIYTIWNPQESFMVRTGATYYKGMKLNEASILSFDLETTGLNPENNNAKILLISYSFRDVNTTEKGLISFDEYSNQGEMIRAFTDVIQRLNPSILCGYNIYNFDIPYLLTMAQKENVTLDWGRDNSKLDVEQRPSKFRIDGSRDQEFNRVHCYGRELVDMYFATVRWDVGRQLSTYGLKSVVKELGLESETRQFYDSALIRDNYTKPEEWKKIKAYCMDDSQDVINLYDKIMPAFFYASQTVPKSFTSYMLSAAGSQINSMMIRAYLQDGHSIPKASAVSKFRGGISFGIPGIYRNCWKLDIKSCYPSAILINKLYSQEKDPNGYMLKMCEHFAIKRYEYKRLAKETGDKYYEALDQTAKVFLNSLFGFCSAPGLNFNDPEIAAKITQYGRTYLGMGMKWATGLDESHWERYATNDDDTQLQDS